MCASNVTSTSAPVSASGSSSVVASALASAFALPSAYGLANATGDCPNFQVGIRDHEFGNPVGTREENETVGTILTNEDTQINAGNIAKF